jgi:hypothetical protein
MFPHHDAFNTFSWHGVGSPYASEPLQIGEGTQPDTTVQLEAAGGASVEAY